MKLNTLQNVLYSPFTAITRVRIPSGTPYNQQLTDNSHVGPESGDATGTIKHGKFPPRFAGLNRLSWVLAVAGLTLLAVAGGLTLTGCGGMSRPGAPAGARVPPGPVNAPFNVFFNAGMIGRTDTFSDGAGCFTFFTYSKMPPSDFFPPDSIIMTITKSAPQCYWSAGTPGASIDFILSPLPDGSFRSMGWVFHAPLGIPAFWSCRTDPCTQEIQTSAGNAALPYMIIPPADLKPGESRTFGPTAYDLFNSPGVNFNYFISDSALHARNQFWLTRFTRSADGHSVKVEQWEGTCGHEVWTLQDGSQGLNGPNVIESPNDGPPGAPCVPPLTAATITRIS